MDGNFFFFVVLWIVHYFCYDIAVFYDVAVHVHKNIAKEKQTNIRVFLSILGADYLRNTFTRVVENGEDTI